MSEKKNKKVFVAVVACAVVVCLLLGAFVVFKLLLKEDDGKRRRQIQRITLVKPPPPPPPKEKLPEPEIKKKEEVIKSEPEEQPPEEDLGDDQPPPEGPLGLDAEGSGAGDAFGMQGRPGGTDITKIGTGGKNLLKRYAWYTRILQDEIREKVNRLLEEIEDIPAGKHKMMLRIKLDEAGNIVFITVHESSGNPKVDKVVEKAIKGFSISQAPPEKMPRAMKIKVTFKS